MSNELIKHEDFTNQLAEFDKIQDTCRKLLQTKHYAALGEVGVHTIMARAKALGIHPFEALNGGFYVVHGKVGMSTEMMAALVRKRGHSIRKDSKSNNEICILHAKRADTGDEWTCSFSREDAEAAGLWGTATWKKYPGVMLYNRCMSMLFRQLFPDLSLGAGYVEDELREITKTGEYKETIELPVEKVEHVKPLYKETKSLPNNLSNRDSVLKNEESSKFITSDQAKELERYLDECDPNFKNGVLNYVKVASDNKYEGLEYFPAKNYERTLKKAKENREEFIAKQMQEVNNENN